MWQAHSGGDPYGVLWYCVWNRGYREWLAAPPAGHRSSLRDGGVWGDNRRDAASSVLAVHWGHRRDVCASVLAVYFAEHRRLEQGPDLILDWRDGLLHEARVVVLVMIITRRLNPGEGRLYRAVRMEALRESPGAFLSRYEDAVGRSDESWAEQADGGAAGSDRATFVSLGERPVGVVSLYRVADEPEVGELLLMWVAPEVRGGRVAGELLMAVLGWAGSHGFALVKAEVMGSNGRALRFYEKFGFLLCSGDYAACGLQILRPVGGAGVGEALRGDGVVREGSAGGSTEELR